MNLEILKPILIDSESLKVGDRLWSLEIENCVCKDILPTHKYAIIAGNNEVRNRSYTDNGYCSIDNNYPSLFKCNPFEWLANQNNQERVIEVWCDNEWVKRILHMFKNGKAICWGFAETIEDAKYETRTTTYIKWRELPQTIELTIAEIAEKFGLEPHQIKIHEPNSKA